MASPQVENGHIDIANEIAEKLARWHLSSYEQRVLWVVFRKTWGWHKKEDWISLSQFSISTGISRSHVCRSLNLLIKQNMITKRGNTYYPLYRLQKDFDKWKPLPNGARRHDVLPNGATGVTKRGNQVLPNGAHTKETITKETIQKKHSDVPSLDLFSISEEITKLENNSRRDMNIIALFFEEKKPDIRSKEQLSVAIKRHLRAAKNLSPFTDEQILNAIPKAKSITSEWTLETLIKVLSK